MKAVINEKETPKGEYPCLKEYNTNTLYQLVLFKGAKAGTLISQEPSKEQVGYYSEDWSEQLFTPFTGSITLSND